MQNTLKLLDTSAVRRIRDIFMHFYLSNIVIIITAFCQRDVTVSNYACLDFKKIFLKTKNTGLHQYQKTEKALLSSYHASKFHKNCLQSVVFMKINQGRLPVLFAS